MRIMLITAGAVALMASAVVSEAHPREAVEIQFLSISDWHAQLDPLFVFGAGSFGGAAELSTYFQQERALNPNTLTLTAGDAFGASLPLSAFFDEVPAVEAMNLMGSGASYTLATNDFVAAGGDGYPDVSSRIVTRDFLAQDVADYVGANTPISPAIQGRISCAGGGCPVALP